jgi:hypothetical protein
MCIIWDGGAAYPAFEMVVYTKGKGYLEHFIHR